MNSERILTAHARTHPTYVEGCYGCRISTVNMGAGDANDTVADINRREKALVKDRDAYRRLRADGLQPNNVGGSDALEARAMDQVEIDFKVPIPKKDLPQVKEIMAEQAMQQWGAQASVNGG